MGPTPRGGLYRRRRLFDCPSDVVDAAVALFGEPIAREIPAPTGYTLSVASALVGKSGNQVFVKAGRLDEDSGRSVLAGVDLAPVIGDLGPPLRAHSQIAGWIVALYEFIQGDELSQWDADAVDSMAEISQVMRQRLDPSPMGETVPYALAFAPLLGTWRALAGANAEGSASVAHIRGRPLPVEIDVVELAELEADWLDALGPGTALQHGDIRRDNVLREKSGRLWLVDWTHRWVAPGWVDLVRVGPDMAASGHDAERFLRCSAWADAPAHQVNVLLAGLAGRCWRDGHLPTVDDLPQLRPMQLEQGLHTLRWLAQRLHLY